MGEPVTVVRHGAPWVTICPASADAIERARRLERFRLLAASIEHSGIDEPVWDDAKTDRELLNEERVVRFG